MLLMQNNHNIQQHKKPFIRWGGGLGDAIKWYCICEPAVLRAAELNDTIILSCNSHNRFQTELLTLAPYGGKFQTFTPLDELRDEEEAKYYHSLRSPDNDKFRAEHLDLRYLIKNGINPNDTYIIGGHHVLPGETYKLYPTAADKIIINSITDKPIIVIAPGASESTRLIPDSILQRIVSHLDVNEYNVVLVGRSNSNINSRYSGCGHTTTLPGVINLVDQITIQGTLSLIDQAHGLICSDSSLFHFGAVKRIPMLVLVPSKTNKIYGLIDINDRLENYFSVFSSHNVVVVDFADFCVTNVNNFNIHVSHQS
jgi:hypothetical protein